MEKTGGQAVPAFIFNERYLASGAQDADFFKEMLLKLSNEEASQETVA